MENKKAAKPKNNAAQKQTPPVVTRADGRTVKTKINAVGAVVQSSGRRDKREDPAFVEKLCKALADGNPQEAACWYSNISPQTFYRWMRDGRSAPEGSKAQEFFTLVKMAETKAEMYFVAQIRKAARKSWQAAAWWLERRRSEHYGKNAQENSANFYNPSDTNEHDGSMSDDEKRAALKAMLRRRPDLL